MKRAILVALALTLAALAHPLVRAQQPALATPAAPPTPRAAAPIDLTGYWVSVVTEDWRWRMLTPPKGDYTSVPLNPEGRKTADTWDPAQAASSGCKPYGAAAVLRAPGRLHVTWDGDTVLKIETDAGQQTRLLRFDKSLKPTGERTWQGFSAAEWELVGGGGRGGAGAAAGRGAATPPRDGSLKVVTTNMRPGYLRKNGVPYSENALMTEYFDRHSAYGTDWFTVTTLVEDPKYLTQPFITTTHFKKEADGSKWSPAPCE
jgi:hypothetical protein